MAALKLSSEDPHLPFSLVSCRRSIGPDSLRELEESQAAAEKAKRYSWALLFRFGPT